MKLTHEKLKPTQSMRHFGNKNKNKRVHAINHRGMIIIGEDNEFQFDQYNGKMMKLLWKWKT